MKSLHDASKHNRIQSNNNEDTIEKVLIGVTILAIVGMIFGAISFVLIKVGCRARERLGNGLMALFWENGIRPNNEPAPFNV